MKTTHLVNPESASRGKSSAVSIRFVLCVTTIAAVLITSAQAQSYGVLYSFAGGTSDGASPSGMLVEDASGNFYGTTGAGGAFNAGTVFKLDSSGVESVLYSFTGSSDGSAPLAGVFRDPEGYLYGTTSKGGDSTCKCGTVFKLSPAQVLTTLHKFQGAPNDGANPGPASRLISVNGKLYTVTTNGGNSDQCVGGCGVVFSITKGGKETVIYQFEGVGDGFWPYSLVRDTAGNLYGSAEGGWGGAGTAYGLDTSGSLLWTFEFEYQNGSFPIGHIIVDDNGNIHGVTAWAGHNGCDRGCGSIYDVHSATGTITNGCGVIYQLSKSSQYSALHSFAGTDGALGGELVLGTDGSLYGVTSAGGTGSCTGTTNGCGVIFKYTP
jgi:uncharacterized repeat protein (TIGR03803 family)